MQFFAEAFVIIITVVITIDICIKIIIVIAVISVEVNFTLCIVSIITIVNMINIIISTVWRPTERALTGCGALNIVSPPQLNSR